MGGDVGGFAEDLTGINLSGNSSSDKAGRAQENAAAQANATQRYIFDQTRADQQPWRDAGINALGQLGSNDFQKTFSQSDFQTDPGYAFRMQEGQKALERSAAARGGLNSGGTLKALVNYGQNQASNEYQNAYNRFNNDQTSRFNRLSSLAGIGQTATNQVAAAGQNYGNNVANTQIGLGNAQAANSIAQGNKVSNMVQQGASLALLASDERVKTNIEPVSSADLAEFRAAIKPYRFNYANDIHGEGDWVGVMAQDLEKSKLGKMLVEEIDGVKKINLNKFASVILATFAE